MQEEPTGQPTKSGAETPAASDQQPAVPSETPNPPVLPVSPEPPAAVMPAATPAPSITPPAEPPASTTPVVSPTPAVPRPDSKTKWLLVVLAIIIVLIIAAGTIFAVLMKDKLTGLTSLIKLFKSEEVSEQITTQTAVTPDIQRKNDLDLLKTALENYKQKNNSYPVSDQRDKTNDPDGILNKALVSEYLAKLPTDPSDPVYYYGYKSDGSNFELTCVLEDTTDPAGRQIGNYYIYTLTN